MLQFDPVPMASPPVQGRGISEQSLNRMHAELDPGRHWHDDKGTHAKVYESHHGSHDHDRRTIPPSASKASDPVKYTAFTITKLSAGYHGEGGTWAYAERSIDPASEDDLKKAVKKREQKGGKTAYEQLTDKDMEGNKRKQVDQLIEDRARLEHDPMIAWTVASIKLIKARPESNLTKSMHVILKGSIRKDRPLLPSHPSERPRFPLSGSVDLRGVDNSQNLIGHISKTSAKAQAAAKVYQLLDNPAPWGHGVQVDNDRLPVQNHGHIPAHHAEQYPSQHELYQQLKHNTHNAGYGDGVKERPKVVQVNIPERHKRDFSDSETIFSGSDASSLDDAVLTPGTTMSSDSEHYRQDKVYEKLRKNNARMSGGFGPNRDALPTTYREHVRKVSYPSPRRAGSEYSSGDVLITPEVSRRPYRGSSHRQSSYHRERPPHHRPGSYEDDGHYELPSHGRTSSYPDDRQHGQEPLGRHPSTYQRPRLGTHTYRKDSLDARADLAFDVAQLENARDSQVYEVNRPNSRRVERSGGGRHGADEYPRGVKYVSNEYTDQY